MFVTIDDVLNDKSNFLGQVFGNTTRIAIIIFILVVQWLESTFKVAWQEFSTSLWTILTRKNLSYRICSEILIVLGNMCVRLVNLS